MTLKTSKSTIRKEEAYYIQALILTKESHHFLKIGLCKFQIVYQQMILQMIKRKKLIQITNLQNSEIKNIRRRMYQLYLKSRKKYSSEVMNRSVLTSMILLQGQHTRQRRMKLRISRKRKKKKPMHHQLRSSNQKNQLELLKSVNRKQKRASAKQDFVKRDYNKRFKRRRTN